MVLKNHTPFRPGACNFAVGTNQAASRRQGQAGHQVQQGGLAATRVPDQGHKLTFGYGEVDGTQGREIALGGPEGLCNVLDFDVFAAEA